MKNFKSLIVVILTITLTACGSPAKKAETETTATTTPETVEEKTITVTYNEGGKVYQDECGILLENDKDYGIKAGTNFGFFIEVDEGYAVDKVTVDDEEVTLTNDSYEFSDITDNHTVNVTFKEITEEKTESEDAPASETSETANVTEQNDEEVVTTTPAPEKSYAPLSVSLTQVSTDGSDVCVTISNDAGVTYSATTTTGTVWVEPGYLYIYGAYADGKVTVYASGSNYKTSSATITVDYTGDNYAASNESYGGDSYSETTYSEPSYSNTYYSVDTLVFANGETFPLGYLNSYDDYDGTVGQSIIDTPNLALYENYAGYFVGIFDHAYQGFKCIKNYGVGSIAHIYWSDGSMTTLQCVSVYPHCYDMGILPDGRDPQNGGGDAYYFMQTCNDSTGYDDYISFWNAI